MPVSVNLSRSDFESEDMFRVVETMVRKYAVPRNMLNIEITESAFSERESLMATNVEKFRSAGYQVWMDDFGG